jgi:prepilin-type N-terminal cleavage/methylation domain-containing protein
MPVKPLFNQSAFSLIEILVALSILSVAVLGLSQLLLEQRCVFQEAEYRQRLSIYTTALVESVRNETKTTFWREKIESLKPGITVTITQQGQGTECVYIITIQSITVEIVC